MTLHIGRPEGVHELPPHPGLVELWVRNPTDLFDPIVPLAVYKLPGDHATEWRHMVQVPPGVELFIHPHIEQGTAWLVFEGGSFRPLNGRFVYSGNVKEVKGRKRQAFVPGGFGVLRKVVDVGAKA